MEIKVYRTVILCFVLYGCKNWLLKLREERRLRLSVNRVLGGMFGAKRVELRG